MSERLPKSVRMLIDAHMPHVSPLVSLELTYLHEVGRARDSAETMLAALRHSIGLQVSDISLADLAQVATGLSWTRDPFDRLIAAHAIAVDAPLVTADQTILANLPLATWGQ
jgi:PIN domain nuclease of toxin-antitoxin system